MRRAQCSVSAQQDQNPNLQPTLSGFDEVGMLGINVFFRLLARVTLGEGCLTLRPEKRLRATMTGTEDLLTR